MTSTIGRIAASAAMIAILGSCGVRVANGPVGPVGSSVTPAAIPAASPGDEAGLARHLDQARLDRFGAAFLREIAAA